MLHSLSHEVNISLISKTMQENHEPTYLTKTDAKFLNILANLFEWFIKRIKHDDQVGVITVIQVLFNIQKSTTVIYPVHRVNFTSLTTEKAFAMSVTK